MAKDLEDDWMNPRSSYSWTAPKLENKTVYSIQRAKRTICFGNPGSYVEWKEWRTFETKEERDRRLDELQNVHVMWQLRAHDYNPYLDSIRQW